ncbi:MAG: putative capsid assembly scaffolding protein [Prokaryotic dsDNA virus sp.]|mgnify:CR=1 FL=1|nr:MAG: putative capsid assembly scaffolding protein [Prokaryotic dsDNA virus sp.]|tara:strand:- start:40169 stop:41077 length:909 start_codon:yes stop_codon:yes gene_type:complete
MFIFKHKLMEEAGSGEQPQGGGAPAQEGQQQPTPTDNWKEDPRLDENGNPKEEAPNEAPQGNEQPNKDEDSGKVEDKTEDKTEGQDSETPKEFDGERLLDTPVVSQVESLIKDAGLDPSDIAKAVSAGDGKLSTEALKALSEKHGDAVASLVANQLQSFHREAQSRAQARDKAAFDHVQEAFKDVTDQDGQKTWTELSGWAKENIPNDERKEINKLLQQGGIAAKYALDDLVNRFKSSDSFVQNADLVSGDSAVNDNGLVPISKQEYSTKLRELEAKGHVYGQSSEMDKLDRQRVAGQRRGI